MYESREQSSECTYLESNGVSYSYTYSWCLPSSSLDGNGNEISEASCEIAGDGPKKAKLLVNEIRCVGSRLHRVKTVRFGTHFPLLTLSALRLRQDGKGKSAPGAPPWRCPARPKPRAFAPCLARASNLRPKTRIFVRAQYPTVCARP